MEKVPFVLVVSPVALPTTITEAPTKGVPSFAVTVPVMVRFCAIDWRKQNSTKRLLSSNLFFIIKKLKFSLKFKEGTIYNLFTNYKLVFVTNL